MILIEKLFQERERGNESHLRSDYHLGWSYDRSSERCVYQMEANGRKLVVWFCPVFSSVLLKENLLKRMAGKMLHLEDEIWMRLNYGWSADLYWRDS